MSDDNILNFDKIVKQKNKSLEERFVECMTKEDCKCMYCTYRENAATMVTEFLASDIWNFQEKSNATFSTFDMKDILFKAIYEVKKWEQKLDEKKDEKEPEDS